MDSETRATIEQIEAKQERIMELSQRMLKTLDAIWLECTATVHQDNPLAAVIVMLIDDAEIAHKRKRTPEQEMLDRTRYRASKRGR